MPSTYTLIASNTLGASAASVTFSSIPSTYTDLVLRVSARTDDANQSASVGYYYNGNSTSAQFSRTQLTGSGSAAASARGTGANTGFIISAADGSTATANTFGSGELYIPNYAGSANKTTGTFGVSEDNATAANMGVLAGLWSNTAAISSMTIVSQSGGNFVAGSSFYLYGIKNS